MNDQPKNPIDAEREIFLEALKCESVEERSVFLDRACANDPAIRVAVEALLRHHKEDKFMQPPGLKSPQLSSLEKPGDRIGRYKLLQQIGEGGCGVVYMAEQEEPVRRRVALKVIKLGMDTKNVIARFEAERQALALMDHPNIAKVLEAGATDTGRPYFVMELVRGIKITDYCDQNNLSTKARLDLFIKVCQAIQHAHQKGVIHRDIKPSNILVTISDGVPLPKVIDFGIAKATSGKLTDHTLFTAFEQFIGTPAYMSPEQAEMSAQEIDTRSDIYSLGVLLYELLTGQTPFDAEKLLKAGLDEIRRTIREEEPARPSTRLSTMLGANLTEIAKNRNAEPPKLIHLVSGDLDWIVMKALEKDRARRYETANGFAADIQRHLNNEPVEASPPGNLYKFQKLVRRNKLAFIAASAVLAALIIGLGVSTLMFVREKKAHEQTIVAEREQSRLREAAEQAQSQEASLRRQAQTEELAAQQRAYAADMYVAFQAWEKGDLSRVDRLLDDHRPQPGEEDMRGFEWFYLWRLCHSDQLTLRAHNALMRAVAFSPDGRVLATAGDDSTARLWDAHTGKELFILGGHRDGVTALAFSPDGKTLATGAGDKEISLWDVRTGKELAVLRGHNYGITALAFGPDGKWLASADGKLANNRDRNPVRTYVDITPLPSEIKLWNIETRKTIVTLTGYTNSILSLAISPDGKWLATGGVHRNVKIWEVATGIMETNITGFNGPVFAVAFSPDGQSLAVGGGDPYQEQAELKILDLANHTERMTLKGHDGPVFALAFSPDGKTLASGGLDQIIRLWNVASGDEVRTIKGHRASIWSLAWSPGGDRIASASWDQTVKVWDIIQPQGQQVFPGAGSYSGCFSPDGKYLIRSGWRTEVFEPGTTNPPYIFPDYIIGDSIVAMSPDGLTLASGGLDSMVTLWQVGSWRRLTTLPGTNFNILGLAFSPDSRTLAFADDTGVRLWDIAKRVERTFFPLKTGESPMRWLTFTPDGRKLLAGNGSRNLLLDAVTKEVQNLAWNGIALSPDRHYLAVSQSGSDLGLVDLKTMQLKWLVTAHRAYICSARFSPDDKTLAIANWDGTASLWNVASGQEMFSYRASGVVWNATFSQDGKWLSVGSGSDQHSEMALFRSATPAEVQAADLPAIYVQPVSQISTAGRSVTFGVSAVGEGASPLSYQWRKGADNLSRQTNATLTLANVTAADAGDYSVVVTNLLGSATSSNAMLKLLNVREETIAEVNFQDKQPAWSSAFTYCENPVPLTTNIMEVAGAGVGGTTGLVMTADGSGFTNNMSQNYSGFAATVGAYGGKTNGIDTTDLGLYKLYATIRTAGLTGKSANGSVQWDFVTVPTKDAVHTVLALYAPVTFTTNYQVYSFVLSDGLISDFPGGSFSEFKREFDQINGLQLEVQANEWVNKYDMGVTNALYISNVKFVRLVPVTPSPPGGVTK